MPKTVAFAVSHDSQLKWAEIVGRHMRSRGWRVVFAAIREYARFSEAQIVDAGLCPDDVVRLNIEEAVPRFLTLDAVVLLLIGDQSERILYAMREHLLTGKYTKRPVMAAGYVGVVVDGHTGGLLYRAPADVVFVNSRSDLACFTAICSALGIAETCLALSGLAIVPAINAHPEKGTISQVVFADQIAIPLKKTERWRLYQGLIEYALAHPERKVIVKPRYRPGEVALQKRTLAPEAFFSSVPLPKNLSISYVPLVHLLPQADLLLTVSSTAALEALAHGVKVAILSDAGVKEAYGNHIFVQSGLIRSLAQVMVDDLGSVNPEWLRLYQSPEGDAPARICAVLEERCAANERAPLPLSQSAYFTARRMFYRTVGAGEKDNVPTGARSRLGALVIHFGEQLLPPLLARPLYRLLQTLGIFS